MEFWMVNRGDISLARVYNVFKKYTNFNDCLQLWRIVWNNFIGLQRLDLLEEIHGQLLMEHRQMLHRSFFFRYMHDRSLVSLLNSFADASQPLPRGWEQKTDQHGQVYSSHKFYNSRVWSCLAIVSLKKESRKNTTVVFSFVYNTISKIFNIFLSMIIYSVCS